MGTGSLRLLNRRSIDKVNQTPTGTTNTLTLWPVYSGAEVRRAFAKLEQNQLRFGGEGGRQSAHGKGPEDDWPPASGKMQSLEGEEQSQVQSISLQFPQASERSCFRSQGLGMALWAPLCPLGWRGETGTGH